MSQTKIAQLTPQQEALIPVILENWKSVALSTQPLNRQKARSAIKAAYAALGKKEPAIRFFSSPKQKLTNDKIHQLVGHKNHLDR